MIFVLGLLNALSCRFAGFNNACVNRHVSFRVVFATNFSLRVLVASFSLVGPQATLRMISLKSFHQWGLVVDPLPADR